MHRSVLFGLNGLAILNLTTSHVGSPAIPSAERVKSNEKRNVKGSFLIKHPMPHLFTYDWPTDVPCLSSRVFGGREAH